MLSSAAEFAHIFVPAQDAGTAPTLLLLHGTGGDENDLLDLGRTFAPQANLLGVRGRVLEGAMPRFFRRLAEGIFDEPDIRLQADALADFVGASAAQYGFNEKNVWAVGYSNGANIAGALFLLRPEALAGGVLLRAMVALVPNVLPQLDNAPVFLGAGSRDPIAAPAETERLTHLLRQAGARVTTEYQPAGHGITPADVKSAQQWMTDTLSP